MLSGIKTVKLAGKRKDPPVVANNNSSEHEEKQQSLDQQSGSTSISSVTKSGFSTAISKEANAAAADELRKALLSGLPIKTTKPAAACSKTTVLPNQSSLHTSELVDQHTERLLRRFPIIFHEADEEGYAYHPDLPVTIRSPPTSTTSSNPTTNSTTELEQLRQEERTQFRSMDEIYARNIARLGSRYKDTDFNGKLETEQEIGENNSSNMFTSASSSKRIKTITTNTRNSFDKTHLKSRPNTNRDCWWWCQSSSFHKHMLLAIGEHISLVLAPSYASLVEGHCYLVPNQPAESFVSCSNRQLWDEVERFQTSLRNMFWQDSKQKVLFCETTSRRQARMEVVPCPIHVQQDAAMYFRTSFMEENNNEEDDATTKLHKITAKQKLLQLPFRKRNSNEVFPYAYAEWEINEGYAQIMSPNKNHSKQDWLLDTIAAMLNVDPIRFKKNQNVDAISVEKASVWKFLQRWKDHDWTANANP